MRKLNSDATWLWLCAFALAGVLLLWWALLG